MFTGRGDELTCGCGRKEPPAGRPPAGAVAVTIATVGVGGLAVVVVSVERGLVGVVSVRAHAVTQVTRLSALTFTLQHCHLVVGVLNAGFTNSI